MLLLAVLSLTVLSSDLPQYQQFCDSQGFGNCFPVTQVLTSMNFDTIVVDNRDPIAISNSRWIPMFILGEQGWELAFQTEWGSGVLVQKADLTFIAEIPLADDVVLHIFPCSDQEECTSFGYELQEDVDFVEVESDEEDEEPADARRRSLEDVLRRSLDSTHYDCFDLYDRHVGHLDWCTITIRIVLPASDGNEEHLTNDAVLIVAEFNEALENSINSYVWEEPSADILHYVMALEHVDFVDWDESKGPGSACWEYKQTHDDTDITHCIVYDTMQPPGKPGVMGRGKFPDDEKKGMSWAKEKTMPEGSHSGRHTSAHELGHNLDARHVYSDGRATLMTAGSELDSTNPNRLLEFETNARAYEHSGTQNNVETVRDNFQTVAEWK